MSHVRPDEDVDLVFYREFLLVIRLAIVDFLNEIFRRFAVFCVCVCNEDAFQCAAPSM